MFIHSIGSAFPPFQIRQREIWETVVDEPEIRELAPRSRLLLRKIFSGDSGIENRYSTVSDQMRLFRMNPGELNHLFEKEAPALAEKALGGALSKISVTPSEIDALFICTCTGYLCPGVSSHVAEVVEMRSDIYLHDVVGLGCGAAIPTLRAVSGFLADNPDATVACVAVEICSSAFFLANDPGVLVSLALFGDGACATIWKNSPGESGYEAGNFQTLHRPEEREKIRFVNDRGFLRNKLHRAVPGLAADAVAQLYESRSNPNPRVLTHTGGRDVIEALEEKCGFDDLSESRETLRNYGNTSSPSVLIALEKHLDSGNTHDHLWLTTFGAGFACHSFELNR